MGVKEKKQQANKELGPLLLNLLSRYYLLAPIMLNGHLETKTSLTVSCKCIRISMETKRGPCASCQAIKLLFKSNGQFKDQ